MERSGIEKIAKNPEDRLLLAKLWDKINAGVRKNIPANTCFLAPRELELAGFLFGNLPGLYRFGGYEDAERKMLVYLPDYLEESALYEDDSPLCCLEASFFEADKLSHRDFLGALMGAGIARETVGDICVEPGRCLFFVTAEITPPKSEEGQKRTASRSPFRNMCEESVMNMNEVIARINALAKKAKEGPLTEEEQAERDNLRRIYIDSVKANLVGQLENTYILQPDGTKKKVTKK